MATQTTGAEVAEQRAWVVAEIMGQPVTWGELHDAFSGVRNAQNWKNPVDATVEVNDREMAILREAVTFFTGSVPTFTVARGGRLPRCRYRVRAAGYYKEVGA